MPQTWVIVRSVPLGADRQMRVTVGPALLPALRPRSSPAVAARPSSPPTRRPGPDPTCVMSLTAALWAAHDAQATVSPCAPVRHRLRLYRAHGFSHRCRDAAHKGSLRRIGVGRVRPDERLCARAAWLRPLYLAARFRTDLCPEGRPLPLGSSCNGSFGLSFPRS